MYEQSMVLDIPDPESRNRSILHSTSVLLARSLHANLYSKHDCT